VVSSIAPFSLSTGILDLMMVKCRVMMMMIIKQSIKLCVFELLRLLIRNQHNWMSRKIHTYIYSVLWVRTVGLLLITNLHIYKDLTLLSSCPIRKVLVSNLVTQSTPTSNTCGFVLQMTKWSLVTFAFQFSLFNIKIFTNLPIIPKLIYWRNPLRKSNKYKLYTFSVFDVFIVCL
jgi:hypothetical protein